MAHCDFCDNTYKVDKIKIKGIKRFNACEKCQTIINTTITKNGEAYSRHIENLEHNFRSPKNLLNLLYILPHYKKCGTDLKVKKNYFLKYVDRYKQSNFGLSLVCQILIFVFLNFAYLNHNFFEMPFWKFLISSFVISFITGVVILNTGVTSVPCKNVFNFFSRMVEFLGFLFKLTDKIAIKNAWCDFFVCFFIRVVIRILIFVLAMAIFILSIIACCIALIVHASILFVPAYYIDYKRRKIG